ncbi:MAG TPA: zinc-ribbon domain-containing protein [Gemmatimonadales bacterium]|nr:zinc-ribbon domain-containing protein [Gemmatimonadales bacterium]
MTAPATVTCPSCHAPLSPGARYCHRCGRSLAATSERERKTWIGAWAAVLLVLAMIVYFVNREEPAPIAPDMANAGNLRPGEERPTNPGAPPDISQMSPRERFLRLHDRIMAAGEQGDSATAQRFLPMALAAYGMIDTVDVDLRYHAGALHIRAGDYPAALALADTIMQLSPDNLLGDLLRLEVAQDRADSAGIRKQAKAYLDHFDRQIASGRAEYTEHRNMLDDLRRQLQPR